jgi:hypothetical protein
MNEMNGHIVRMGKIRNARSILAGKPEDKTQLGRSRRRFENNIRMNIKETECECVLDSYG